MPLETLSRGLTSWESAQSRLVEGALLSPPPPPPLLPGGAFVVVVDTVSKYVIPLRPSYIIAASRAFRGAWKQNHFQAPVLLLEGISPEHLSCSRVTYLIFFYKILVSCPFQKASLLFHTHGNEKSGHRPWACWQCAWLL